jgi:predicted transcriptional regulator
MPSSPIRTITRVSSTIRDLLIYLYDLSPLDLDLLFLMIRNGKPATLEELAKRADRDKSTVFRSLQKLVSAGICVKETKTIKEGGYYHLYAAVDTQTFKMETERRIRELQKSLDRLLKKFDDDLQKAIPSFYQRE